MREIKFRGRNAGLPICWIYGSFVLKDRGDSNSIIDSSGKEHLIRAGTAGQFTGLRDRNNKEIYEGDIIRFQDIEMEDDPVTGYIDFRDGTFIVRQEGGSVYRFWNDGMHDWHTVEYLDCEATDILGNIHENPELLKAKETSTV